MELMLATKIAELDVIELEQVLAALRMQDRDAFELFKELVEDAD